MQQTEFQTYPFAFEEVCPSLEEICEFLKLDPAEEEHPALVFIDEVLPELHANKNIRGGYKILPVDELSVKKGSIVVSEIELQLERQVCGYLKGSDFAALFVCTAGSLFTELTHHFNSRGDLLEAYIVDAIGSLTVEKAMDKIQFALKQKASLWQMEISNRYSPGYCEWHLSSQQALFGLIGENPSGVSLTDSCLMQPIKSVSGIIGIGKTVTRKEYGCVVCQNESCIYRKIKQQI
ncbi:MAG: vitamin B12 dependent-methionine synthase activation domain-containing protein [Bacteroidota bacterium]|nr:vitamin B12 dependent-methionine synthase activation domain-containing protein [Bacteroidota bacterium]